MAGSKKATKFVVDSDAWMMAARTVQELESNSSLGQLVQERVLCGTCRNDQPVHTPVEQAIDEATLLVLIVAGARGESLVTAFARAVLGALEHSRERLSEAG